MKLDGQTEADLGFYICFFQIYQSLGLEVTPWSRGWSGCYADSHTNLLGNQKYNHVDFWHGTVYIRRNWCFDFFFGFTRSWVGYRVEYSKG